MEHVGLVQPKSNWIGGLRDYGITASEAIDILAKISELEMAGALAVEVEVVPERVLNARSSRTSLMVVSIGAGARSDVTFLYSSDICGEPENVPRHAKRDGNLLDLSRRMREARIEALTHFNREVKINDFPAIEHSVEIPDREPDTFLNYIEKMTSERDFPWTVLSARQPDSYCLS